MKSIREGKGWSCQKLNPYWAGFSSQNQPHLIGGAISGQMRSNVMLVKMDVLEEFLSSCSKRARCADTLRVFQLRIFFTNLKVMHLQKWLHHAYIGSYTYFVCIWEWRLWLLVCMEWYGGSGAYLIPPLYSVSSRPANTFTLQPLNLTFLLMIMLHVKCPFCALQKQLRRN